MIPKSALKPVVVMATLIATASVLTGQSGRRGTSKSRTPAPPTVTEPAKPDSKSDEASKLQLIVGVDSPSMFERLPYYVPEAVLYECVRRMQESKGVTPLPSPSPMSRAAAIEAAKSEGGRHVVWLQVGNENAVFGAQPSTHTDQLYVRYTIFEPGTAKIKNSGHVQYGSTKLKDIGVAGPPSTRRSVGYSDYAIKQTARVAADKILAAFQIRIDSWPLSAGYAITQNRR